MLSQLAHRSVLFSLKAHLCFTPSLHAAQSLNWPLFTSKWADIR